MPNRPTRRGLAPSSLGHLGAARIVAGREASLGLHLDLGFAEIGVRLTEGSQFDPEQTTAALIVHHPDTKYYALARSGGADQSES